MVTWGCHYLGLMIGGECALEGGVRELCMVAKCGWEGYKAGLKSMEEQRGGVSDGRRRNEGCGTHLRSWDLSEAFRGAPQRQFSDVQRVDLLFFSYELLNPWESNLFLLPFQGLNAHWEGFYPLHQEGRHHDLPLPVSYLSWGGRHWWSRSHTCGTSHQSTFPGSVQAVFIDHLQCVALWGRKLAAMPPLTGLAGWMNWLRG